MQNAQQTTFQERMQITLFSIVFFPSKVSLDWQNISQDNTGIQGGI